MARRAPSRLDWGNPAPGPKKCAAKVRGITCGLPVEPDQSMCIYHHNAQVGIERERKMLMAVAVPKAIQVAIDCLEANDAKWSDKLRAADFIANRAGLAPLVLPALQVGGDGDSEEWAFVLPLIMGTIARFPEAQKAVEAALDQADG